MHCIGFKALSVTMDCLLEPCIGEPYIEEPYIIGPCIVGPFIVGPCCIIEPCIVEPRIDILASFSYRLACFCLPKYLTENE